MIIKTSPEWDLKCKKMTKQGASDREEEETCQKNLEEDYEPDCKKCPAGSYSNRIGSTANKCCPLGHANETKEDCVDSADDDLSNQISTYAQQGGYKDACAYFETASNPVQECCSCRSWTCQECEAGKYQNSTGASACSACPYKDQTSDVGSKTAADCYVSCPLGKYAYNTSLCLACPVHMDTVTVSSASTIAANNGLGDCKCRPGYFAIDPDNPTNKTCHQCPQHSYKSSTSDQTSCAACPVNTGTSYGGATSKDACTCLPGFAGSGTGSTANCVQCVAGKYKRAQGAGYCRSCSQGSRAVKAGTASCEVCEAGKYAHITGSTVCLNCTAGTYQGSMGATACLECVAGKYSSTAVGQTNSSACLQCAGGKYSNVTAATSASVCVDCEPATYAVSGSSRCIECPVGKYAHSLVALGSDPAYCLHCDPGKFSTKVKALSEGICDECHAGAAAPETWS
jgi:hypothetical protein